MDHTGGHRAMSEVLTFTVPEAGRKLGLSRNAAYDAAKRGEIPTIRFGHRLVVPKVAFDRMLENAGQKPTDGRAA
jgi:excisionase family DNA binding protein